MARTADMANNKQGPGWRDSASDLGLLIGAGDGAERVTGIEPALSAWEASEYGRLSGLTV
jgi:hypothetical protein